MWQRLDCMSEVTKKKLPALQWSQLSGGKNTDFLILFCGRFACSVISDDVPYWETIVFPLLCCHFEFKHKDYKWCISGHTVGRGWSRNGGVIPAIPYDPLACGVVPLSHYVGKCVRVLGVNTETPKRNGIRGVEWSWAPICWSAALWFHHGNCSSSTKPVVLTYTQCTRTTLHCSFTLYSTLSRVQELFQEFTAISV